MIPKSINAFALHRMHLIDVTEFNHINSSTLMFQTTSFHEQQNRFYSWRACFVNLYKTKSRARKREGRLRWRMLGKNRWCWSGFGVINVCVCFAMVELLLYLFSTQGEWVICSDGASIRNRLLSMQIAFYTHCSSKYSTEHTSHSQR